MAVSTSDQHARQALQFRRMALVAVAVAAATYVFGLFAFVSVIESESGQTEWMSGVTHELPSTLAMFALVPVTLGIASVWAAHRLAGRQFIVTVLSGPVIIGAYYVLLVALGTRR